MSRAFFTLTPSSNALLVLIIVGGVIHFGGNAFKTTLLARPDLAVLQRDLPSQSANGTMAKIHVIREDTVDAKVTATPPAMAIDLPNSLFSDPYATDTNAADAKSGSAPSVTAVDYFAELTTGGHLRLDAITHNGAIINGVYIPTGGTIDAYAYPAPDTDPTTPERLLAPRLASITQNGATIKESVPPHRSMKLSLE